MRLLLNVWITSRKCHKMMNILIIEVSQNVAVFVHYFDCFHKFNSSYDTKYWIKNHLKRIYLQPFFMWPGDVSSHLQTPLSTCYCTVQYLYTFIHNAHFLKWSTLWMYKWCSGAQSEEGGLQLEGPEQFCVQKGMSQGWQDQYPVKVCKSG